MNTNLLPSYNPKFSWLEQCERFLKPANQLVYINYKKVLSNNSTWHEEGNACLSCREKRNSSQQVSVHLWLGIQQKDACWTAIMSYSDFFHNCCFTQLDRSRQNVSTLHIGRKIYRDQYPSTMNFWKNHNFADPSGTQPLLYIFSTWLCQFF